MEAKTLKQYREERLETVDEFAAFLGVAADTIYRAQNGERMRFSTMKKIAAKLGVTPHQIADFGLGKVQGQQDAS